jgi:hypothetical protein
LRRCSVLRRRSVLRKRSVAVAAVAVLWVFAHIQQSYWLLGRSPSLPL